MEIKNNRKKVIIIVSIVLFLIITPLTTFLITGEGDFDIRSRAGNWDSCQYSKGDLDDDRQISLSDFSIWLNDYRKYKVSNRVSDRSDLTGDGVISLSDFSLWLSLWRQFKACQEALEIGDTSKCFDGCYSNEPNTAGTEQLYVSEEFELEKQKVGLYYPSNSSGNVDDSQAPFPVVIFHHGMGAQYSYYTWIGENFALRGFIVLMPNRPILEMDMEAATKLTNQLLSYLEERNSSQSDIFYQKIDFNSVILSGHSLGSGLSLFASESLGSKIKALVLLSSGGSVSFMDSETMNIPGLELLMGDMSAMEESFGRMREIASKTNTPIMYTIGSNDKMISPEGTKELYGLTKSKKVIAIIEGGNHVQFVKPGSLETQIMNLLDGKATISPEQQRSIALKYINPWVDYILTNDPSAKSILESGKDDVPTSLSHYDYSL